MKTYHIFAILFFISMSVSQTFAQTAPKTTKPKSSQSKPADGTQSLAVTDAELLKYATATDSVNEMLANVRIELTQMVSSSNVMTGERYNELSKIANDPAKLQAANATPDEVAFLKQVNTTRDAKMDSVNSAYQKIAKEYVTGATFNKVKKALTTDTDLKKRYDSLMVELSKDDPTGDQ